MRQLKRKTSKVQDKIDRKEAAYSEGIIAHLSGKPDVNKYGITQIMEMCAWSAGYFDSARGMLTRSFVNNIKGA